MNRRSLLLTLIFAVPLAALIAWWLHEFEYVSIEVDQPLRGEARYNPLYALKKTLQAQSIEVAVGGDAGFDVDALAVGDALVLTSDVRLIDQYRTDQLFDWIESGGHLIFELPPVDDDASVPMVEALGIHVTAHASCLGWPAAGSKPEKKNPISCFSTRFHPDEEDYLDDFIWHWGNAEDGYLMGRQLIGDGSVFVASDLDFLDNRSLDDPGIAALAWQILAPALGHGKAHLVYASDVPPLHVLLVRRGWPILLPLVLALFGWLWLRSQRFGPLLPLAAPDRRALLEHVQAAGEFAFHRGRALAMYAAVHRMFIARLRRRDPALAALEGEALVQALAERTQLAAASIRQALQPVDLARPDQFLATIKTLMQLRAKT